MDKTTDMRSQTMKYSPQLQRKADYSIGLLRKAEALALRLDPENGFYLAFSGGKDSQVLYHLAKMAGVKFKAHMSLTSVDPPEVIRFVRRNYPGVEMIKPAASMYDMAIKKRFLPTRRFRWCCAAYKEKQGLGKVTLIGIRRQESARRSRRGEMEYNREFSGNFDQWSEHNEKMVACVGGKEKILVSPMLDWTEQDVWEFLNTSGLPHCSLYDEGYRRIGCILCPMSSRKDKARDIARYPHAKRNWVKAIQKMIDTGIMRKLDNAETAFKWWTSGKIMTDFSLMSFCNGK